MSNRFDERYEIRLAHYEEIPEVMNFINSFWKENHILAKDRAFFEYEMVINGVVDFVIAKSKLTGQIEGIHGFLPCSESKDKLDIWGVIWKTIPEAMPMLGMELKKRTIQVTCARTELGVGANSDTSVPLLNRIFHYYTAKMKHYYRLAERDNYKIAIVNHKEILKTRMDTTIQYKKLSSVEELERFFDFSTVADCIPYKDSWYYERRFYRHPKYSYELWGLTDNEKKAVVVIRKQECNGETAVRIVDYLGNHELFSYAGEFLDNLLEIAEYVDFYFDGFEEEFVKAAGMQEVIDNDTNIIPDYFNPFEQRNVDIYVDSSDRNNKCIFFKADGDQDRPS